MVLPFLQSIIFPPSPSIFITAMSAITIPSLANAGFAEVSGKHMRYSKFWDDNSKKSTAISSRTGMLIAYTPAFLACVSSFGVFPDGDFRFLLLKSALTLHFFKRIFEVLFIHKYSGKMVVDDMIPISVSYFISASTLIYAQHLTQGVAEPSIDLKYLGTFLFLIGIGGNFYHHYLLSTIRKNGDKEYKIPKGGLFDIILCPHYLFEILGFLGFAFISQTLYAFSWTLGTTLYLMGRSYATRRWYISKFKDFPRSVKTLIPYVF